MVNFPGASVFVMLQVNVFDRSVAKGDSDGGAASPDGIEG